MQAQQYKTLSTTSMQWWLRQHRAAIEAGANVGDIDRAKAQRFRVEIARRNG